MRFSRLHCKTCNKETLFSSVCTVCGKAPDCYKQKAVDAKFMQKLNEINIEL